jgi:hypothetical protein
LGRFSSSITIVSVSTLTMRLRRSTSMRRLRAMRKSQVAAELFERSNKSALRQTVTITSWAISSAIALSAPRRIR